MPQHSTVSAPIGAAATAFLAAVVIGGLVGYFRNDVPAQTQPGPPSSPAASLTPQPAADPWKPPMAEAPHYPGDGGNAQNSAVGPPEAAPSTVRVHLTVAKRSDPKLAGQTYLVKARFTDPAGITAVPQQFNGPDTEIAALGQLDALCLRAVTPPKVAFAIADHDGIQDREGATCFAGPFEGDTVEVTVAAA